MKIYILRHEDRTQDATMFSPLTSKGLSRSVDLIEIIKKCNINKIYSSPYIRTLQTILPYSKAENIPINLEYSLAEIQSPYIIPERSYNVHLPRYIAENFNYNPKYKSLIYPDNFNYPENEKQVSSRVRGFLNYLLENKLESDSNILIVTHQVVCNQILKVATKRMKDVNISSSNSYPRGGLTCVFNKDEWLYEPINWTWDN